MQKMILICSAAMLLAMILSGCGCDKHAGKKCVVAYGVGGLQASGAGSSACSVYDTFSKCIKDANCCAWEEDGHKVKDIIDANEATFSCQNPC